MPRGLLNCIFWRVTNIEWPGTNVRGQNIMIFYQNSSYVWSKDFQSQWKLPLLVKAINAFSHMHVLNPYKLSAIRLSFTGTSTIRFCVKNNLLLCIYIILFMSPDVLHDASWFFYHKRKQIFPIFFISWLTDLHYYALTQSSLVKPLFNTLDYSAIPSFSLNLKLLSVVCYQCSEICLLIEPKKYISRYNISVWKLASLKG